MWTTVREMELAALAARIVFEEGGGFLNFGEYDEAMERVLYFTPIHWGPPIKANSDKMCAFAAVAAGLLVQTEFGYRRTDSAIPEPQPAIVRRHHRRLSEPAARWSDRPAT